MKFLIVSAVILLGGCTNANSPQTTSLESSADVTCYSGGHVIYHAQSIGKVSQNQSGGWYFQEKGDRLLVRVNGQCVIISSPR